MLGVYCINILVVLMRMANYTIYNLYIFILGFIITFDLQCYDEIL